MLSYEIDAVDEYGNIIIIIIIIIFIHLSANY